MSRTVPDYLRLVEKDQPRLVDVEPLELALQELVSETHRLASEIAGLKAALAAQAGRQALKDIKPAPAADLRPWHQVMAELLAERDEDAPVPPQTDARAGRPT